MTESRMQTFTKEIVVLDDHAFIDCTFDDCALIYAGGPCIMRRCKVFHCETSFIAAASNTMSVMLALGMMQPPAAEPPPVTLN